MKLWILDPIDSNFEAWEPWYDKSFQHVVRAETETEARELANNAGGDETGPISGKVYRTGGDPWLDPKQSTCVEIPTEGDAEVLSSSRCSA